MAMAKVSLALVVAVVLLPVATAFLSLDAYRVAKIGNFKVKLQISVEETAMDDTTFDATMKQSYVQINQKGGNYKMARKEKKKLSLADTRAPVPWGLVEEPSWPSLATTLLRNTSCFKLPSQETLRIIVLATALTKACFPDLPLCSPLILALTLTTVVKHTKLPNSRSSGSLRSQH